VVESVVAGRVEGFAAAHSLAETYAVLTRLPGADQVAPTVAWQLISENILKHFTVITLTAKEYSDTLESAAANGVDGGRTYDALLLSAAAKSNADRIYTLDLTHFQSLADDKLRERVFAP
jgi:predicted nucleic acid-binding protein